jgi:hypothetical protein
MSLSRSLAGLVAVLGMVAGMQGQEDWSLAASLNVTGCSYSATCT